MSEERPDPLGKRFEHISTEQLFEEMHLDGTVEDEYWERIACLHTRGGRELFEYSVAALNGPDGLRRRIGANVLAQLGYRDGKPFASETFPHLLARLQDSTDTDALCGIAGAFGHLGYPTDEDRRAALPRLEELCGHEDEDVRHAVAFALDSAVEGPDDLSVHAARLLCTLTRDSDRDVRDWATFYLEGLPARQVDLPVVRAALWERVRDGDEEQEIRVQAINGLANHGDRSVIPYLRKELELEAFDDEGTVWIDTLEAATTFALPEFVPALRGMLELMTDPLWITRCEEAIAACESADP